MTTFFVLAIVLFLITFIINQKPFSGNNRLDTFEDINIETAKEILGDYHGIVNDYDELIKIYPNNEVLFYNRGFFKYKADNLKGALQDFSKSISINFLQIQAFVNRAFIKNIIHDYNGALQDYNTAINNIRVITENNLNDNNIIEPDELVFIFTNRASIKVLIKDYHGAINDCNISIKLEPEESMAYYHRGLAKINLGDNVGARFDWLRSGELGCFEAYEMINKYFN